VSDYGSTLKQLKIISRFKYMAKHKRYSKTTTSDIKKNLSEEETPAKLRSEFPEELIKAFVYCHDEGYTDRSHEKYIQQAKIFLQEKFKDVIEQGRLTVRLTKATFDLVNNGKKKKTKAKKNKRLARSKCALPKIGADEGQEERSQQETLPEEN
jgi:hypothetical protein